MQLFSDVESARSVVTVSELNRLAKKIIEGQLPLMWVAGEISNFTRATSGHCYFSLKDGTAQVRCVMFRQKTQLHDWKPANGMQVEVRACPSFYEARGEFQLNVEVMRRSGLGALYEAFERLKVKLQAEGLFDTAAKQPVPPHPRMIGIVTSPQAAALRDVLTTLRRRMAGIPLIIYPTMVQGTGAAQQIAAALGLADARAECDVLILCRGGGSIEDLWSFNEEVVARAIYACRLPVISGIGHETDFTIADFVADLRAPTPTAAAQMACPSCDELRRSLSHVQQRLLHVAERALEHRMQQADLLARRLVHPGERITAQLAHLSHLASRLHGTWRHQSGARASQVRELGAAMRVLRPNFDALASEQQMLARRLIHATSQRMTLLHGEVKNLAGQLTQLNPRAVLERGYTMVESADGRIVRDSAHISVDDEFKLTFGKGGAVAQVVSKS